jgi:small-conductance mechanosensitive channel
MKDLLDHTLFHVGDTGITLGSLAICLALLVGSYLVSRLVRKLVSERLLGHTHMSPGMRYALGRFAGYLVLFLGAAAALQTVGVHLTTLAAFGAAVGVGIGFGLQDIVKNFVAGLILLVERPFQVGDRIEIDDATAEVVEVRARATVLRTNDDVHMIVPNSKFVTDTIVNRSFDRPLYRCRASVAVDSLSDPHAVEEALLEAARKCEGILPDPPPSVRFRAFGDGSLAFEVLGWTEKVHRSGALVSNLNFLIHEELTKRGIRLPTPPTVVRAQG